MYSANTARDSYVNSEILNASPLELVRLLYRGALEAVGAARRHLARREVRERSRAVTRASLIIGELSSSLDLSPSDPSRGELARQLAALYDYLLGLLARAQLEQSDAPLAEAEGILGTLAEAWQQIAAPPLAGAAAPRAVINLSA
jgi:flagellar protein FliS